MKLLRTVMISVAILVPLAWMIILLLVGSFSETMESIFVHSFFLPFALGCAAIFFLFKGTKEAVEQKKFSGSILTGVLLLVVAIGAIVFLIKNAW